MKGPSPRSKDTRSLTRMGTGRSPSRFPRHPTLDHAFLSSSLNMRFFFVGNKDREEVIRRRQ